GPRPAARPRQTMWTRRTRRGSRRGCAMRNERVLDLADCTEFRQTLMARPPRLAHGVLVLLLALVGAALLWAALTPANLVVLGQGRVRPATTPTRVGLAVNGRASAGRSA